MDVNFGDLEVSAEPMIGVEKTYWSDGTEKNRAYGPSDIDALNNRLSELKGGQELQSDGSVHIKHVNVKNGDCPKLGPFYVDNSDWPSNNSSVVYSYHGLVPGVPDAKILIYWGVRVAP